jgi:hypothetical protein
MLEVIIAVREPGRLKPDTSARFELPEIPAIGSYITVNRPGESAPWGEEMIVKKIWWILHSPSGSTVEDSPEHIGTAKQIIVLCEAAIGPFSTKSWRRAHEGRPGVQAFEVSRFSWEPEQDPGIRSRLAMELIDWADGSKPSRGGYGGEGKS